MKSILILAGLMLGGLLTTTSAAEEGFVSLFNDRDLSGWVNVNGAPDTWVNRGALIACTGKPISMLRTERQYENFILEAEWRHLTSGGNSGIFVWASPLAAPGVPFLRGIEVQILDNGRNAEGKNVRYTTHGDLFPTHGSTMTPTGRISGKRSFPTEERSKSSPEWNHYRVVCQDGTVRLSVNGKEVTVAKDCNYRQGYLALESEGAPVEFRNLRLKELPPSGATPEVSAPIALEWRSLFTGLDLTGWTAAKTGAATWSVVDDKVLHPAGTARDALPLLTQTEFGDMALIVDVKSDAAAPTMLLLRTRAGSPGFAVPLAGTTSTAFRRFTITVQDRSVTVQTADQDTQRVTLPASIAPRGAVGFRPGVSGGQLMNLYVRDL